MPNGLQPQSINSYAIKWRRYCRWAEATVGYVPGKEAQWDAAVLWQYMQHRGRTCKPSTLTSIRTMLAHFSARFGYVLPTHKSDGNPALHRSIEAIKKQLAMDARVQQATGGPNAYVDHCTALGQKTVGNILSSFQVFSKVSFRSLSRVDRHNVMLCVVQHAQGMRYGHFAERDYDMDAFVRDADGSYRLVTDWHRYSGKRMYCLEFLAEPRYKSQIYNLRGSSGAMRGAITAATILDWHFEQLRETGETRVFDPTPGKQYRRGDRQTWLRTVLQTVIPRNEIAARAMIQDVSPHSFRSGLAADLYHEGVDLQRIASICRWANTIVVRLYAERPRLSMLRTLNKVNLMSKKL